MEVPKNKEVSIIREINEKIDNLEKTLNIKEALVLLKSIENDLKWYKLYLSINWSKNELYIIWQWKWDKILLNIPFKIGDVNNFSSTLNDIKKLLNYDWNIQIIWWKEWRSIADIQWFWWDGNAQRLIHKWLPHWKDIDFYVDQNNKLEELFVFIQKLKWIPEKEWVISDKIQNSTPLWNINSPIIKKEEN